MNAPLDPERSWRAVAQRDGSASFLYAVKSTGVYCVPGCRSRLPKRENVSYFDDADAAEAAGFRACLRCRPRETRRIDPRLERARALLESSGGQSSLKALAEVSTLSQAHLQRRFTATFGLSPKRYGDALKLGRLKEALRRASTVTEAIYEAGFGSSSRVYGRASRALGMTPREYRNAGRGQVIEYASAQTEVGMMLVACTGRGLCAIELGDDLPTVTRRLSEEFPAARLVKAAPRAQASRVLRELSGLHPPRSTVAATLGTAFQKQVWEALLTIPRGEVRTYQQVADHLGRPTATRAVAHAIASNRLAVLIPCHRVIRSDGGLGGYRWGEKRKRALLKLERAPVK